MHLIYDYNSILIFSLIVLILEIISSLLSYLIKSISSFWIKVEFISCLSDITRIAFSIIALITLRIQVKQQHLHMMTLLVYLNVLLIQVSVRECNILTQ